MNDQQLKQRIAHLVEHGGIHEDPLTGSRRDVRVLYVVLGVMAMFELAELLM